MSIRWEEITYENTAYLESALKLYDQSFPMEVREPHHVFLESLKYSGKSFPNTFKFLIGFEGEQLVSFATAHYLAEVNTGFIVYICIDPHIRSKGLGSKTLVRMEEILNEDAIQAGNDSLKTILLETEKLEAVHTAREKEDCVKRNRFFERNNYVRLETIEYIQPPLHEDGEHVPLQLFSKQAGKDQLSIEEIKTMVKIMYKEKYFNVNKIDRYLLEDCLKKMGITTSSNLYN
jgi:GNAT superfamily N-acetyltransferase